MKIYDVDITDVEAHRNNTEAQQEAIFAHLPYYKKKDAVRQLREALNAPVAKEEPAVKETIPDKPKKGVSK